MSRSSRASTTPSRARRRASSWSTSRGPAWAARPLPRPDAAAAALYAASEDAQALGLGEAQLAARCSACGGSGVLTLDMGFLPDVHVPCETCRGTGLLPEAWEVRAAAAWRCPRCSA